MLRRAVLYCLTGCWQTALCTHKTHAASGVVRHATAVDVLCLQATTLNQENHLLRRILIAYATEMAEAETVNDNVCSLAGDLLQLLTQQRSALEVPAVP